MKKRFVFLLLAAFSVNALTGCRKQPLTIWVGSESQEFYADVMNKYVKAWEEEKGGKFPHKVEVKGVDSAAASATFIQDTDAGADIFTIPHDNLGKLTSGASVIAPITDEAFLADIYEQSMPMFHDVIKSKVGGQEYTFAAPVISQSLVMYYNKKYVTPEQTETWESMLVAAEAATATKGKKVNAFMPVGEDGYNNSFLLLGVNETTKESSLRLYEKGDINDSYVRGEDTVARLKWGQRFFAHEYGAKRTSSAGWQTELKDEMILATVTGAWNAKAARQALGTNFGVAMLPKFTITEADAVGDVVAGTVMRSGTFVDTKALVMKKNSEYAEYLQPIMQHLFSKEIQEASFDEVDNLPAYKNALEEFEGMATNELALRQIDMYVYGRPQPFGADAKFNFYFYSNGAPDRIMQILINPLADTNNANGPRLYDSDQKILNELQIVENIWKTGTVDGGAA